MNSLDNQNILITGASSGIGRACAALFASERCNLILVGRRPEPLEETARQCRELGAASVAIETVDLEQPDDASALGARVLEMHGHVDVLVNNAGHSSKVRSIRYIDAQEWESVFRINIDAVFRLTQALIESMVARDAGTVITVSSMAALKPGLLGGVAYGAAKAASLNMMQGLTAELRDHGIRACTIIPSEVDTPILDNRPLPPDQAARDTLMQPEDVAQAIMLCARMPSRTLVEQIVLSPARSRDMSAELTVAAAPPGSSP
jgi:NADP-dependent 3-hydroxy acid dehydrogenase YdfG